MFVVILLGLWVNGCGVTIQTGPEDKQRLAEVSDTRAREIRSEYSERIRAADPMQKAEILKTLVDSVSANYFRYGERVADDWDAGNQARGAETPASDMRSMVERSNESQRSIFAAYEDVVDLAMEEMKIDRVFDQSSMELLEKFRGQFFKNYSIVFYPSGSASQYRDAVYDAQSETEKQSRELQDDLRRY